MWQPGQSGNPKGRRPRRVFDDHLREALATKRGERAKALVERMLGKAMSGNVAAMKLICERIGGKPKPVEPVVATENQTLEQVRQQLAVLLAHPEVRRNLETLMKPAETETIQ
jgi:hypothetical protein